jgi:hypothetical protein
LSNADAKQHCIDFISSILGDGFDATIVRQMNRNKDLVQRHGVTFEVTPATDPDAYGGWWISVYDEKLLDTARASDAELAQIAVPKSEILAAIQPLAVLQTSTPTPAPAVPTPEAISPSQTDFNSAMENWTPSDVSRSRRSSTAGNDVYVRSYSRKDGTYVHSYTRSSPRR